MTPTIIRKMMFKQYKYQALEHLKAKTILHNDKRSNLPKRYTALTIYSPNPTNSKYIKQKSDELKFLCLIGRFKKSQQLTQ